MASASKGRRSRKRRPGAAGTVPVPASTEASKPASTAKSKSVSKARQKEQPRAGARRGERPQAPWHPLPLSEIFILVGGIATVVALRSRPEETALLVVGLVAVGIGTFEVTWREHSSGFRSHTILLALVPVLVFHSLVIAIASAFTNPTVLLSIVLLPFDFALFVFCFKLLRARFLDARQLRTLGRR